MAIVSALSMNRGFAISVRNPTFLEKKEESKPH
jgi:hypothetical protein